MTRFTLKYTVVALLALTAPALALIGALAVACFVKVYGIAFLGAPRTPAAAAAHEAPRSMLVPMAALAKICTSEVRQILRDESGNEKTSV